MLSKLAPHHIAMFLLALVLIGIVAIVLVRLPTTSIPAVVATVEQGEIIETSDLTTISWPVNAIYPDLITTPGELVGRRSLVRLVANQPIARSMLTTPNSGTEAEEVVDPRYAEFDANKLEYFLPIDLRRSSGGLVRSGDWVNVVNVSPDGTSEFILQKIHIIGARNADGSDAGAPPIDPATGQPGPVSSLLPVGYMLALTPDQLTELISIPVDRVYLVKVSPTDPDLPGVPTGLQSYAPGGSTGPQLPDVEPTPTPNPEPGSEGAVESPGQDIPDDPDEQDDSQESAPPSPEARLSPSTA